MKDQNKTLVGIMPGNSGSDCSGINPDGQEIDCNKCRYFQCCMDGYYPNFCPVCNLPECPRRNPIDT